MDLREQGHEAATTVDQCRRESALFLASAPAALRARALRQASVRIEYGGIRCENSCAMIDAPAVLAEMFDRHGITATRIDRHGIQHGRVNLTGAKVKASLIVH
ncbi:hypothetical protein [Mycobacteroides abscessus]